jgi:hypothetical protein
MKLGIDIERLRVGWGASHSNSRYLSLSLSLLFFARARAMRYTICTDCASRHRLISLQLSVSLSLSGSLSLSPSPRLFVTFCPSCRRAQFSNAEEVDQVVYFFKSNQAEHKKCADSECKERREKIYFLTTDEDIVIFVKVSCFPCTQPWCGFWQVLHTLRPKT